LFIKVVSVRAIETVIFAAMGLFFLLLACFAKAGRLPIRVNIGAAIYAAVILLIAALLAALGWIKILEGIPRMKIPYFALIFTAAFLYFAIEQRRRQPKSKAWIGFLIASLLGAAAAILEILLPPRS